MDRISVAQFSSIYQSTPDQLVLLDVRTPKELAIANINGATNIPLQQLANNYQTLPKDKPIYCLCHHGMRSLQASEFLHHQGYDVINIDGGIDAWAVHIDTSLQRY